MQYSYISIDVSFVYDNDTVVKKKEAAPLSSNANNLNWLETRETMNEWMNILMNNRI